MGTFIRFYQLKNIPPGFFCDEAAEGYTAYSVLTTGKGIHGDTNIAFFKSISNDIHGSIYTYSMVPFIKIFGLNEFAVRATSAFYGVLTIFVLFLLVKEVTNENIALLSSCLLAISPWHIQFSRIGFIAVTYPFFLILGLWLFYKGLKNYKWLYLSAVVFGLSFYSYAIARLFTPLFLIGLLLFYHRTLFEKKKHLYLSVFTLFIFSSPFIYWFLFKRTDLMMRYNDISILTFNKDIISVLSQFIKNWASYYSPAFLFFSGDKLLRHSVGMGELYLFTLPFIIYGVVLLFKKRSSFNKLLIYWLLIFPIPGSLTGEFPHALRAISAVPLFQIITAFGIYELWEKSINIRKYLLRIILWSLIIGIAVVNIIVFMKLYFTDYKLRSFRDWEYGFGEAIRYADSIKDKHDYIYLTRYIQGSNILIAFYTKYPPEEYHKNELKNTKYRFANLAQDIKMDYYFNKQKGLYIVKRFELPGEKEFKDVYYPDSSIAFKFIEKTKDVAYNGKNILDDMINEAEEALKEIDYIKPNLYNDIGVFYYKKGDIKEANNAFKQAVEEYRYYSLACYNLAETYRLLGDYANAVVYYKRVLKYSPNNTSIHYNMGLAYYSLNDYKNSLTEFENYLAKNPKGSNTSSAIENIKVLRTVLNQNK